MLTINMCELFSSDLDACGLGIFWLSTWGGVLERQSDKRSDWEVETDGAAEKAVGDGWRTIQQHNRQQECNTIEGLRLTVFPRTEILPPSTGDLNFRVDSRPDRRQKKSSIDALRRSIDDLQKK